MYSKDLCQIVRFGWLAWTISVSTEDPFPDSVAHIKTRHPVQIIYSRKHFSQEHPI